MAVYKVEAQVGTKQLLQALEQMPQPDFEAFVIHLQFFRKNDQKQILDSAMCEKQGNAFLFCGQQEDI